MRRVCSIKRGDSNDASPATREGKNLRRAVCYMQRISIKTRKKREVLDITEMIEALLEKDYRKATGTCNLFILHTTAALTTADLDPGTDLDMLDAFEAMIPKLRYRHPHNPAHVPDHILSALIGTSVALPFEKGKVVLGTWQRVVLVELDGPRDRKVVASVVAESVPEG